MKILKIGQNKNYLYLNNAPIWPRLAISSFSVNSISESVLSANSNISSMTSTFEVLFLQYGHLFLNPFFTTWQFSHIQPGIFLSFSIINSSTWPFLTAWRVSVIPYTARPFFSISAFRFSTDLLPVSYTHLTLPTN